MDLLNREQVEYVFRPPAYSATLAPIFGRLSDHFYLNKRFRVEEVECEGAEAVRALADAGHMVLVAPNHADHADPHVMTQVGGRHGLAFNFMAAREVFEIRTALGRWALSKIGVFSVDREGRDIAAIKMAMSILQEGKHPLVIFPEGEIFHHHEHLDPLNEGVATILLRALKGLRDGQKAYLVPTALRYTYDTSVEETFARRLARLEERITWKPRPDIDPVERIYRLGGGLLAAKEVEFLGATAEGTLVERITTLQHTLVQRLEDEVFGKERTGSIPERVKALRGMIRRELMGDEPPAEARVKKLYDDLDTIFVIVQLYSYPGQYLSEDPTHHRIAETIVKLEEDVIGKAEYPVRREARAQFGEPIDVAAFLEDGDLTPKTGVEPLTHLLWESIQRMLDEMTGNER